MARMAVPRPPRMIGFAAQLLGLHHDACLADDNVLHPPCPEQRYDVPADVPGIGRDRGRLLRTATFPENEACFHVCDVLLTELPNGNCATFLFSFSRGILPLRDLAKHCLGFPSRGLWCPDSMDSDPYSAVSDLSLCIG